MKKTSQVTALVCDKGLFVELACRLARDMKRVLYYVPNGEDYIKWNNSMVGYGMEDIEVVTDIFGDHFEYVDVFIFPDNGFGPLQSYLRSIGKKVWGSGMGEDLEMDRALCKEIQKEVGLPVGPYQVIKGISQLRIFLKENSDQFVKISRYRGTVESFHVSDYKTVEPLLNKIEYDLGPLGALMEFIVEEELPDRCEIGMDIYSIHGQLPSLAFGGLEIKNCGFAGILQDYDKFPEPLRRVDKALAPIMKKMDYCGSYSTECRIGKDHEPFLIDFTARNPMPPTPIYLELYTNFSDIVWQGANGVCIDPEWEKEEELGPYGMQLIIKSEWSEQRNWQPIDFDREDRRWIKISNGCKIKDQYYSVPLTTGLKECASIVALGPSFDVCKNKIKKIAKNVKGHYLDCPMEELDKAEKEAEEVQSKYNIKLF